MFQSKITPRFLPDTDLTQIKTSDIDSDKNSDKITTFYMSMKLDSPHRLGQTQFCDFGLGQGLRPTNSAILIKLSKSFYFLYIEIFYLLIYLHHIICNQHFI